MQNEILEKKENKINNPADNRKKLIKLVAFLVVFIGLIVLAITVFSSPVKVSFKAPGNLGFSMDPAVVDENGKIEVPSSSLLEKPHYTFLGWFDNEEGKGETLDLANMVFEESTTVYAIWDVIEYKITYDLNGGELPENKSNPTTYTISHDKITKSDDKNNNELWHMTAVELEKFIANEGLTLVNPIQNGKEFKGWEIYHNNKLDSKANINTIRLEPLGDITLKAIWA